MILTCPSCGTQYVVKDGAIPPGGRQVRCASCKHSWHQDPDGSEETDTASEPETAIAPETTDEAPAPEQPAEGAPESVSDGEESFTEATLIEPRSGPEAEERAFEEAAIEAAAGPEAGAAGSTYSNAQFDITSPSGQPVEAQDDWREPPEPEAQDDAFTPYPTAYDEEPRRRSALVPILSIIAAVIILAAAFWFLAPNEWKARLGLGEPTASKLALVTEHMDRQRLQSGNELLTVTGRIINQTSMAQDVPPLQAQLKTGAGELVHSWTIAPPARSLAPGASASFNSAEVNVPPGGEELTITVGAQPS